MRVTVYTEQDCLPCAQVLSILERIKVQYDLEIDEVSILYSPGLYGASHAGLPVVEIEEGRLGRFEGAMDEAQLRLALEIARRALPSYVSAVQRDPSSTIDRLAVYIGRHWLRFATVALAVFVGLPWLAPVFAAMGWWGLADPIYTAYAVT